MKLSFTFGIICASAIIISGVNSANFATTPPFFGQKYANVPGPRGMFVDPSGDVLVIATRDLSILALTETQTGDGSVLVTQTRIVSAAGLGLNHGLTYHQGYLYASSATTVFRWPYQAGNRTLVTAAPQTVVYSIPSGGHTTRTIIFDTQSRLFVSIGSNANVDPNSSRANIRRFDLSQGLPNGGFQFSTGVLFADGLRNEVGLDFDRTGTLWGVENGADNLNRPDLGGDIHNGNPAEDLNRFNGPDGTHYGYPYCFASYNLAGYPAGTQFAWPTFMNDGIHSDSWCRNAGNNRPPSLPMPAHNAPLGLQFYTGEGCGVKPGALPCNATGDAFVAFHGSWNSDLKVGYRVGWLPFDISTGMPTGENVNVIYEPNTASCGNTCLRPVNAVFNLDGHLIVSADTSNEIFRVTYGSPPPPVRNAAAAAL